MYIIVVERKGTIEYVMYCSISNKSLYLTTDENKAGKYEPSSEIREYIDFIYQYYAEYADDLLCYCKEVKTDEV